MSIKLNINGATQTVDVSDDTPLLWVLRDTLGMIGTKFGCGIGECGACTVLIDGKAERSCGTPLKYLGATSKITTIEGLAVDGKLTPVQQAWCKLDVPQCGYCQGGQILCATALLAKKPKPTDADIDDAMTNYCRCLTYTRIRQAIHSVAGNTSNAVSQ